VKLEEVIGENIARQRARQELSQADLGEALGVYLEKPWSRQAVHSAEKGKRAFAAAELVAFALVLGCELPELLAPQGSARNDIIELPNGGIEGRRLAATVSPEAPTQLMQRMNLETLRQLTPMLAGTVDTLQLMRVSLEDLLQDAEEAEAEQNPEGANPLVKQELELRAETAALLADVMARGKIDQARIRRIMGYKQKSAEVRELTGESDG
jgi:transcriptional regulator with XRE-family HTH domain